MNAGVAAAVPAAPAVAPERVLHLVVRVGDERFAFPASHVDAALDAPAVEWVPVAPAGMLGQLLHRGRMLGAWDAGWAFRLARPAAAGAALVLRDGPRRVALLVDDVLETARIESGDVRAVPGGADLDGVLRGVCFSPAGGGALVNVVRVDALAALCLSVSPRGSSGDGAAR
jgi:chemotaxis signal transduction protein